MSDVVTARDEAPLLDALRGVVGRDHVLADPELRAPFETDWTRRWSGEAIAVVRPSDVRQVSGVVCACAEHDAVVVPQGGNTGLVGGGVPRPRRRQVVLSLKRLDRLGAVDAATMQVPVGAGVTLAALQAHARAAGLSAGLDLGARDSATIGGLVACNAGGLHAIRWGTARARVCGLEAVLADGRIVRRMSGLLKDVAGYDLASLLIGSEGTLGIVTEAVWKLVPAFDARATALVGFDDVAAAVSAMRALRPRLDELELCELMVDAGMERVLDHLRSARPVARSEAYMLIECAGRADPLEAMASVLEEAGVSERAAVAADAAGRKRLLALREHHTDAIAADGPSHKLDVAIPLGALASFVRDLPTVVQAAAPGARLIVFGHLGDGNLHVNVLGPAPDDESADEAVLQFVAALGGTISAEHGVGVQKTRFLRLVRSDADLAAMRALKNALDPAGTLNAGVVLEAR
jgi:FAD/FMN-containing dehydrogenase